jgi:hypothetical protein
MEPILVIADTYKGAQLHAQEDELGREGRDWIYVHDLRQVLGRSGGRYVVYSWGECPSWEKRYEILMRLRMCGFERLS